MLSLRYAATRVLAQASKPSIIARPVQRLSIIQPCSTAFTRSFHQSWKALADEESYQRGEGRERSFSRRPGGDRRSPVRNQPEPDPNSNLFIGNLLFDVTPAQIEAELGQFGEIVKVRVVSDERGLSKGFGFVEFSSTEAATKAKEAMSGQPFFGRDLILKYANTPRPRPGQSSRPAPPDYPPSNTLFIGNMSFQMSDRDLNDLFRDIKNVVDVRVAIDRRTGQPRGFAHADFIDTESATAAKELLEQKVLYGRNLRVNYSPPKISSADQAKDEETPSA